MSLVTAKQKVTLYQVGDLVEGLNSNRLTLLLSDLNLALAGGSFNNFLDALDGAYCTFEGGDDPTQDGIYPDTKPGGYNGQKALSASSQFNIVYDQVKKIVVPSNLPT